MPYDRWGRTPEQARREDTYLTIVGCLLATTALASVAALAVLLMSVAL